MSITEKGPTIFLRLSEKTTGEYDAVFMNEINQIEVQAFGDYLLNYTQAMSITDNEYNLAPRMVFNAYAGIRGYDYVYLTVMDTELEKEIDLGSQYPYGALSEGECIISSDL